MVSNKTPRDIIDAFIDEIADKPIAFHRIFATICGSATSGLFLSQLWYWSKRSTLGGWIYKSQKEWQEETGLCRYEQESARKTLIKLGILNEKKVGVPCKLYYFINKSKVLDAYIELQTSMSISTNRNVDINKQVCRYQQTGMSISTN